MRTWHRRQKFTPICEMSQEVCILEHEPPEYEDQSLETLWYLDHAVNLLWFHAIFHLFNVYLSYFSRLTLMKIEHFVSLWIITMRHLICFHTISFDCQLIKANLPFEFVKESAFLIKCLEFWWLLRQSAFTKKRELEFCILEKTYSIWRLG